MSSENPSPQNPLLGSLRRAVSATPDDVALRVHFAELLLQAGSKDEAVSQLAVALQHEPGHSGASRLMTRALGGETTQGGGGSSELDPVARRDFDWSAAEAQFHDSVPPKFVEDGDSDGDPADEAEPVAADSPEQTVFEVEHSDVRLADVGGMEEVKNRLQSAFLAPMNNPRLRKLFGKSLRGGLLLYGPPGCGKTFLAKAVAGELDARFIPVTMHDVLDMWIGSSEKNVHELFRTARAHAPCVLFFDELDAIGQRRSQLRHSAARGTVNQLLTELDGVQSENDGVFALSATNHPWDVDPALLRPGRFDRTIGVLPPDQPARESIFGYHLRDRPVAGIKLKDLAKRTEGFSGADIGHVCDTASERALLDSIGADEPRMISMADLVAAAGEVTPSTGSWFSSARNVALYGNQDGTYDDLVSYMKKRRLL